MEIELKRVLSEVNMKKILGQDIYNVSISASGGQEDISYCVKRKEVKRSMADFEQKVIKKKIRSKMPSGYKLVVTNDDSQYQQFRCSIESKKRHITLVYAYGKCELSAVSKCLLALITGVDIGTEIEYDSRSRQS